MFNFDYDTARATDEELAMAASYGPWPCDPFEDLDDREEMFASLGADLTPAAYRDFCAGLEEWENGRAPARKEVA